MPKRKSKHKKSKKKQAQTTRVRLSPIKQRYFQDIATSLSIPLSEVLSSYLEFAAKENFQPTLLWNKHRPAVHLKLFERVEEDGINLEQGQNDDEDDRVPLIDLAKLRGQ